MGVCSCTGSFAFLLLNFGGWKMSDSLHIGIIIQIDDTRDYSQFKSFEEVCRLHRCIEIQDGYANKWVNQSGHMSTFVCTLQRPFKGIDSCGVTLVPPESLSQLLDIIRLDGEREEVVFNLIALIEEAVENGYYMIVYGV